MTDKFINNNNPPLNAITNDNGYFNEIAQIIGDKIRFICDDDIIRTIFISRTSPLFSLLDLYTPLEVLDSLASNSNTLSFSQLSASTQKTFCRTIRLVIDLSLDKAPLIDPAHLKLLLEKRS